MVGRAGRPRMTEVLEHRRAGVLLHPTSLPGPGAAGTIGRAARRFVDLLADSGFSLWQTLPLGPADQVGSPYCSRCAEAGDPALIDVEDLRGHALLPARMEHAAAVADPIGAWQSFRATAGERERAAFARFAARERRWLLPFVLHGACSTRFADEPWWRWPEALRHRESGALRAEFAASREFCRALAFQQYLFALQLQALRLHAHARGVYLFGDLPFYLDRNSVDVWWRRTLFRVDADGRPDAVAGVPPDYFSRDGQLWGNPLYDWPRMAEDGYRWWIARIRHQLERFDLLRIDHFRALDSYWAVPAGARTAREGQWLAGPADALLGALREALGDMPLVAEDLGAITASVRALRDRFGLPGMLVLQFGFDGSADNPNAPPNHRERAVVYTGTHDNDTTLGWYASLDEATRARVSTMLGGAATVMPDALIDAAYASPAKLAVIPMQDLLGLGSDARMNTPGTVEGNWRWRFDWRQVDASFAARARERAARHGRLPAVR
jgi:4-alpha-glucanotransferase